MHRISSCIRVTRAAFEFVCLSASLSEFIKFECCSQNFDDHAPCQIRNMGHYCLSICYALCGLLMIFMAAASPTANQQVSASRAITPRSMFNAEYSYLKSSAIHSRDTTCSSILVVSGDSCVSLAAKCGMTPQPSLCSTLLPGNSVCCSAGNTSGSSSHPSNGAVCNTYSIKHGDLCDQIAQSHGISVSDLEGYNSRTWGWSGCNMLQPGRLICLGSGEPPMPASLAGAVCGPQVPGTQRPGNWADLKSLNPCPLNECVSRLMKLCVRYYN